MADSPAAPDSIIELPNKPQRPDEEEKLFISQYVKALLENLRSIKKRPSPDDLSKLSVSQTVSFLAIAYEKVRNAVEYREDHLVLRAAIERILKRRLALNPEGKGEAENLLRELTWARYFPNESLGETDIEAIQKIMDRYISIKPSLLEGHHKKTQHHLFQFLFEFMTCEIEETLDPVGTKRMASFTYFIFQTLKERIKIEGLEDEKKDAYLLVALEKSYRKSDTPYQRYHLFTTFYQPVSAFSKEELEKLIPNLPEIFKRIDEMIANPHVDSLVKFTKKQLPPFLVLFEVIQKNMKEAEQILSEKPKLWEEVMQTCKEKYKQAGNRLRSLAIRSLIYIFATKMLLALILEYPISVYLYGEAHQLSIIINALFPPALMLAILLLFRLPGEENTRKIFERILNIVDKNYIDDHQVSYIRQKKTKNSIIVFAFTIVYSLTFLITLYLIRKVLLMLNFNIISQALFIFFISVVSFFSYRIKQIINEYKIDEKEGVLSPIIDFFFIPILAIGKFFSKEIGRLNIFILIFDFIIEAPFKLIIEVFEEWIKFVRARKEEIV